MSIVLLNRRESHPSTMSASYNKKHELQVTLVRNGKASTHNFAGYGITISKTSAAEVIEQYRLRGPVHTDGYVYFIDAVPDRDDPTRHRTVTISHAEALTLCRSLAQADTKLESECAL